MKKCLFLYVVVFACFAESSFAQLRVSNLNAQKTSLLQIPMVRITPVSSLFVPVHIDRPKPFVVSLDRKVLADLRQGACNRFKNLTSTLILRAERVNDVTANLQWETTYAFYATGFEIERSLGDSLHFVSARFATVSKATSFKIKYSLPDLNGYSDLSFYRIKQRNGDRGFAYSNIVSIKGNQPVALKMYPSPATSRLWLDMAAKQSGNALVMVYDVAGKLMLTQSIACITKGKAVQSIDISKLTTGVYPLRILLPDKTFLTGKFMKE